MFEPHATHICPICSIIHDCYADPCDYADGEELECPECADELEREFDDLPPYEYDEPLEDDEEFD